MQLIRVIAIDSRHLIPVSAISISAGRCVESDHCITRRSYCQYLSGVGPFKLVDMGYVPDVLYVHTLHEANG
jgi:hypothetical protein